MLARLRCSDSRQYQLDGPDFELEARVSSRLDALSYSSTNIFGSTAQALQSFWDGVNLLGESLRTNSRYQREIQHFVWLQRNSVSLPDRSTYGQ
ncbi:hypothetical protein DAI22_01g404200 [Oryza sativa Japonica Group]|nr:hypothetical protein DAI22_01g404200 [Oryza sativa Japonica Group]